MKGMNRLMWSALLICCWMFFHEFGYAWENKCYTMEDAIQEALTNNLELKAKSERIQQATFGKKYAGTEFLPKLSTSYGHARLGSPSSIEILGEHYDISGTRNYQWKGTITQPVFTGFALRSMYRLAELGIDQAKLEVELEKLDLILKVKEACLNILSADMAVETAQKGFEALASHAETARNFYSVGMIPRNEVLQSEVEAGNAKYDLVRAQNNARIARAGFNAVLSRPISAEVQVVGVQAPHTSQNWDLAEHLEKALRHRPEIKLIQIQQLQVDQKIRSIQSKNYPEVVLQYDYIREGDEPSVSGGSGLDGNHWEIRVGLTWTFWEWGKTHYAVQEQESVKIELQRMEKNLEETIELQIKDAIYNLQAAEANLPITRKAVEQGEENIRITQERYKAQETTSMEVLDAQRYLTNARTFHLNAIFQYHLAIANLKRATGEY